MAIEDEIINISDLDVGTEILQTDKLLIETNNGTKLLDFKDFVVGIDNISFYHLISGQGDATGTVDFSSVGGFRLLTRKTSSAHKPTYSDLEGGIELAKRNYTAFTWVAANSGQPGQNFGDIQNILARLGHIQALLEKPITVTLKPYGKIRMKKTNSYGSSMKHTKDGEWYDEGFADLEIVETGTDTDLVQIPARSTDDSTSGNTQSVNFKVSTVSELTTVSNYSIRFDRTDIAPKIGSLVRDPFKMTYPDSGFTTSTISYSVYIELKDDSIHAGENNPGTTLAPPIVVYQRDQPIRKHYPQKIALGHFVYDFSFVAELQPKDYITIKYDKKGDGGKVQRGSSFSGVRMF